jgi:hypothetical protein
MTNPRNPLYDFDHELERRAEQISKLPVWARDLINHMHREITETRDALREITEGVDGNTTIADPHGSFPRALGANPTIEHEFLDLPGHRVQVDFSDDRVTIYENGPRGGYLSIVPRGSNSIDVRPIHRSA